MGARRRSTNYLVDSEQPIGSSKRLEFAYTYWIARYPITVGQYQIFIKDEGYENRGLWASEGWAWRTGEWDRSVDEGALLEWLRRRPPDMRKRSLLWDEQSRPSVIGWIRSCAPASSAGGAPLSFPTIT